MPLSPTELQEEALGQLRQLVQSPGWALYQARLRSLSKSREVARNDALRAGEGHDAVLYQGMIDGLDLAIRELDRYVEHVARGELHLPSVGAV